jgi:tetratricopeptide (TPR) repeat protein
VVEEIQALTASGIPSLMLRAMEQIRQRNLGGGEFGRIMNAVNIQFFHRLYPETQVQLPSPDPPQSHSYARILRDTDRGIYAAPPATADYLESILPFLALLNETRPDRLLPSLPDLRRAASLNPGSVLAPYFIGLVYERTGSAAEAQTAYTQAFNLSWECYPAGLGLARLLAQKGDHGGAIGILQGMMLNFPDNAAIKRQLAVTYYQNRDWSRAQAALAESLQRNPRDGELLLMQAHVLVEQGQVLPAQRPLDQSAGINAQNPLYLFLRARVQAEGLRNTDAALNYLRSLVRSPEAGEDALIYTARLLMESNRVEDQTEGRTLLRRLMDRGSPSPAITRLAIRDAITRQDWQTARDYLSPLLQNNPQAQDLLNAYTIERGLGNNAAALSYARELYEKESGNDDGIYAYTSALIETGRQSEAGQLIEGRLASSITDVQKSRYYYLRSRIRSNEDQVVSDLRASLFADPRNLASMIAMFEFYHFRRPEKPRAIIYLRQALAIDPANPQLRRYAEEYPEVLGN